MNKADLSVSVIFMALTLGASLEIPNLPVGSFDSPGAGFFPFLAVILLGILSLIYFGQAVASKRKEEKEEARLLIWEGLDKVALTVIALLFFVLFFEYFGFLICTFLMMTFLLKQIGQRKWVASIGIALISAIVCHLLFISLLNASLPAGLLSRLVGD